MTRVETIGRATLYLGDCREVLPTLGKVDHIITDPPYSERTHKGHDAAAGTAHVRALGYAALSPEAAFELAGLFASAATGWIAWMTDHTLALHIEAGLLASDRYVFAPLPFHHPGRSVRLTGDGPSSWTDWIVVARSRALSKWGTLPGGYVAGPGWNDKERMGGKPTRLMQLIVDDYSRRGDTICDPFMGAGTTGVAAVKAARDFIGIEIDSAAFDIACRRIEEAQKQADLFIDPPAPKPVQQSLLGDAA